MLTVRCSKCKRKIFRYKKVGKGRLLRCWKEKILEDNSIRDGDRVLCECGNLIGIDEGARIKMKQNAYDRSGTITR